jgi:hypothetical protein
MHLPECFGIVVPGLKATETVINVRHDGISTVLTVNAGNTHKAFESLHSSRHFDGFGNL